MTTITIEQSLETRVAEWTQTYADTITENYRQYHIKTLEGNLHGNYPEYAREQLDAIKNGTAKLMKFRKISGKKYYKVVQVEFNERTNTYRDGSVTAFVDKNTGEVYKPASWKSPAKHVRFDMRIINHRKVCHDPKFTTWTGGFLYMR